MRQEFFTLELVTNGQKLYEFTENTLHWINDLNLNNGLLNLSIQHTSASLIVQENADPDVRIDLKNYFNKDFIDDRTSEITKDNYQFYADYAYQVQKQTQEEVLRLVKKYTDKTFLKRKLLISKLFELLDN